MCLHGIRTPRGVQKDHILVTLPFGRKMVFVPGFIAEPIRINVVPLAARIHPSRRVQWSPVRYWPILFGVGFCLGTLFDGRTAIIPCTSASSASSFFTRDFIRRSEANVFRDNPALFQLILLGTNFHSSSRASWRNLVSRMYSARASESSKGHQHRLGSLHCG